MKDVALLVCPGARLGRVLRLSVTLTGEIAACAILAAGTLAAPREVAAQARVLPLPAFQASTIPANGDVNPYGVAFVPASVPTDGSLQQGAILVSNFNNSANMQGTGTTVVQVTPQGETSLFFTSTQGKTGLSAALGILADGIVISGYLPSTDGTFQTAQPGGLLFIDRRGTLLGTLTDPKLFDGPWGMAINDHGAGFAQVFVSNVENGSITRLDLSYSPSGESITTIGAYTIGSSFPFSGDAAAFEVGPSGMAYDEVHDVLYVSSEVDSAIYAIAGAGNLTSTANTGKLVYQDLTHLHGPLDLALTPDGHLLVANSDGRNADPNQPSELVEFNVGGEFLSQFSLDPDSGGAFGLATHFLGHGALRVAAVDDNQNLLNMWTTVVR
jgi:DNA-binding beta-propeller fold protein YncE